MNIVLFGPPGSGKGTQGDCLVKNLKLLKVSSGDLLREEINKFTTLGKEIKVTIDKGQLVSNDIINNLIHEVLSKKENTNRLIFDGYPRNIDQAKDLDSFLIKFNQNISYVLNLNIEKDVIKKRILGRQTCSKCGLIFNEHYNPSNDENHSCGNDFLKKRSDDNEQTILERYKTYENETLPVIRYYKDQNLLHDIDANVKINDIYKQILAIIKPLKG